MDYFTAVKQIKNKEVPSVCLLTGDEQYLFEDVVFRMKKTFLAEDEVSLSYVHKEASEVEEGDIENFFGSISFFSTTKIMVLRRAENLTLSKKTREFLQEIEGYGYLLLMFEQKKGIYSTLNKNAETIVCNRLDDRVFDSWVKAKILREKKKISRDALELFKARSMYLEYRSPVTLFEVNHQLQTLCSFDEEMITKDRVEQIMPMKLEDNLYKLQDAIGKRDRKEAFEVLNDLYETSQNFFGIIPMLSRYFDQLLEIQEMVEKNIPFSRMKSEMSISSDFIMRKYVEACRRFSHKQLMRIQEEFLKSENRYKTSRADIYAVVESVLINTFA